MSFVARCEENIDTYLPTRFPRIPVRRDCFASELRLCRHRKSRPHKRCHAAILGGEWGEPCLNALRVPTALRRDRLPRMEGYSGREFGHNRAVVLPDVRTSCLPKFKNIGTLRRLSLGGLPFAFGPRARSSPVAVPALCTLSHRMVRFRPTRDILAQTVSHGSILALGRVALDRVGADEERLRSSGLDAP
jgi:hypothetical protein